MARVSTEGEGAARSRRDEILEIAAEVFAERGIKGATVRDIGEAAGILSGSLYHHFESKEQIVLELLMPSVRANHDRLVAIVREATGVAALAEMIRATVDVTSRNPHRAMILRNGAQAFGDFASLAPVADVLRSTIRVWFEVVDQGVKLGELRADVDAEIAVRAMLDGTLGASRWFVGSNNLSPDHVADMLIALYVGGMRNG